MGLMDSLGGALGNALQQQGGSAIEGLLGQVGGLDGMLKILNDAGLGEKVNSWLGMGENMPLSADEIAGALGSANLQKVAGLLGVDSTQAATQLAQLLPGLIDKASPQGSLISDLGGLFGK